MDWILGFVSIALLVVGLIGQAFEMRKTRLAANGNEVLGSANIFMDKTNFKWYAVIGLGIVLWLAAERM